MFFYEVELLFKHGVHKKRTDA